MKIEFEIDERDSVLLLDIIKKVMGQTQNEGVFEALSKMVKEIEKDLKVTGNIFIMLRDRIHGYTNGSLIHPHSNMIINLGISENFITRMGGLEYEANVILRTLVKKHHPNYDMSKVPVIPLQAVKKCKLVSDVQNLIQDHYEKV